MTQNVTLLAPNQEHEISRTMSEHPEIDTMDEAARGEIIQITAARLNAYRDRPWGRKARSDDPANPNLNTDGMTFLRPDGLFEIIDVISGTDGSATWDECGAFAPGENGYWYAVPGDQMGQSGDLTERLDALEVRIDAVEDVVQGQGEQLDALMARVTALEQPHHCHGPIDLPVVVDGFSLRTRGDINVAVKPGEAEPPPPPSDDQASWLQLAALKRLLARIRDDQPPT